MRMLEMLQNVNFKSKPETDSALKFQSKMATRLCNLICNPDCNSRIFEFRFRKAMQKIRT